MHQENRKNSKNWTKEERDRIVGFFDLLVQMDKKQNPDLYKTKRNNGSMVVLDRHGKEVIL